GNSPLTYPTGFSDFSDILNVASGAQLAFDGNNGNDGAISKLGPNWFSTFLGFGFETLSSTQREAIFNNFLTWCEAARTLHADDFESNGFTFWTSTVP
ncbi:MAG: hypothetical protein KDB94_09565, partial [Acidobacteria bacterium]|nr:hypothetical protein [Acidobacteriota bacterium]